MKRGRMERGEGKNGKGVRGRKERGRGKNGKG